MISPSCVQGFHESLLMSRQGVGAKWLREWCARASGGAASATADDTATLAVARALLSKSSGDEIAAELYDLFGDSTDLQAVQDLLELRCLSICRLPVQVQNVNSGILMMRMAAGCRCTLSVLAHVLFICMQSLQKQVERLAWVGSCVKDPSAGVHSQLTRVQSDLLTPCCCRKSVTAGIRQQVEDMRRAAAADKPSMPTYGTAVRHVPATSACLVRAARLLDDQEQRPLQKESARRLLLVMLVYGNDTEHT